MQQKKFEQIDTLRFFSVLLVLCSHWGWFGFDFLAKYFSGARGVDMFFVISGFLITLGLIKSKDKDVPTGTSLYKFYIRRFLRIFPIYYLVLALLWIFAHERVAGAMGWYVLYLSNFYSIKIQDWGGVGHLWSLAVEEQFYFVWPLLILLTPRRFLIYLIIGAIMLSECTKIYWVTHNWPWWYWYMHPIGALDTLALGALLAYFYYYYSEQLRKALYHPIVISAVLFIAIGCLVSRYTSWNIIYGTSDRLCFGILFAWIIGRAVYGVGGVMGIILNNSVLRYIGTISYCMYLIHPFMYDIFFKMTYSYDQNIRFLIYSAITVGVASISWYAFEKPILKLKEKFE